MNPSPPTIESAPASARPMLRLRARRGAALSCILLAGSATLLAASAAWAQSSARPRRDPEAAARRMLVSPGQPWTREAGQLPDTPHPRIVEQVRAMSEQFPMRPIVVPEVLYAGYYFNNGWWTEARLTEELYRKHGSTGLWDDDAVSLLRLAVKLSAGDAPRSSAAEARAVAEKAITAGCDDPLFLHS